MHHEKLLISISLLFSTVFAADALIKTITDGNFVFEVDTENGTAELLRLVNNDIADLQIPRVAHDGSTQFLVNELGNQALNGCSKIKSLVITDNITMLYKDAFLGCTSLTEIEFQESSRNLTLLSEWDDTGDHKLLGDSPLEKVVFNRPCSNLKPYAPFKGKPTLRKLTSEKDSARCQTQCSQIVKILRKPYSTKASLNWNATLSAVAPGLPPSHCPPH